MRTRTIHDAALAGVLVLGLSESVGACDRSCRDAAQGPAQDRAGYGYRAYLAPTTVGSPSESTGLESHCATARR